jgi:hypothetical protein
MTLSHPWSTCLVILDNLDLQPEYPLQTSLTFYEQVKESTPTLSTWDIAETTDRFGCYWFMSTVKGFHLLKEEVACQTMLRIQRLVGLSGVCF